MQKWYIETRLKKNFLIVLKDSPEHYFSLYSAIISTKGKGFCCLDTTGVPEKDVEKTPFPIKEVVFSNFKDTFSLIDVRANVEVVSGVGTSFFLKDIMFLEEK
ncbi:MAG: hypothetical protein PHG24_00585 [Candidatus Pacebacteria bacterium]|nr:hypothetical protein [Candidatus Paceibacterota bacterium]